MQASDAPPTITDNQKEVVRRFEQAAGVVCCLDFDGTLSPIVDEPADAEIEPDCRSVVARLADAPWADVAIISGRAIDDLRTRVRLDDVVYAGNHGLELDRTEHTEIHPEADDQRAGIDQICVDVSDRTGSFPGVSVEHKGVTATVHYRQVPDDDVPEVLDAVDAAVADAEGEFEVVDGKQIREIRPRVDWDKGRVVEELARDVPGSWDIVYVGDDTTDEDAFEVVEPDGVGVLVGDNAATAASFRVPDQSAVVDFLSLIEASMASETGQRTDIDRR